MRLLITLSALLLTTAPSLADCRRAVVVKKKVDVVVVEKQVALAAVFVPLVSVGYAATAPVAAPVPVAPSAGPPADVSLRAEVERLRQEVQQLRGGVPPGALPLQQQPDVVRVFAVRCGSCHEQEKAASKGGKFVLLEGGKLANLKAKQVMRVLAQSHSGAMPPVGPPLTTEEKKIVQEWVEGAVSD